MPMINSLSIFVINEKKNSLHLKKMGLT